MKAGIAGAGIIGQLMAFCLINAGWNVTLFDRRNHFNCSMAAAGLLTPIAELNKHELLIYQLGLEALNTHWPAILTSLQSPIYFSKKGSLILSHPHDRMDAIAFIDTIAMKLDHHDFYQSLNHDELIALEPDAAKFNHSYYIADEGQIDNQAVMHTLRDYLIHHNMSYLTNEVTCIKPHEITTSQKKYLFDWVLDCRGLGAKKIDSRLRGVRGEIIWLDAPDITITRPIRFLHPRYSLYIVPRPNHTYIIGASDIESDDHSPISVRTTLELLTAAYSINADFGEARIIKTVTHCRPTLPHHLPEIKTIDGFISINGLYRHGFLISPTLATEVMRFLNNQKISYPTLWETLS